MAAEDVVAGLERKRRADRRAFLADREMGGPLVGVGDPRIGAGRFESGEHGLELADDHHVPQGREKGGVTPNQSLLRERRPIRLNWNIWKREGRWLVQSVGVDEKSLGHARRLELETRRHFAAYLSGSIRVADICIA